MPVLSKEIIPDTKSASVGESIRLTRLFVRRKLEAWPGFRAALIVGSIAHREARPDSDVDCVFVFDPMDERVVPAEFVWVPATDSYHSILETEAGGVQIDAKRWSLGELREGELEEGYKNDLANAITLADRDGTVTRLLEEKLAYTDELRRTRVAEHYGQARHYLEEWRLGAWIERGGLMGAHDQITAAFEETMKLLHARNGVWLPWRYRRLISTRKLPLLPDGFAASAEAVTIRVSPSEESLWERRRTLTRLLDAIEDDLRSSALLPEPENAFREAHPELGYAHNMDAWRRGHEQLLGEGSIAFRPLRVSDLPLLHRWLNEPHVVQWYGEGPSYRAVEARYLPRIEGREPVEPYLILHGDFPIGYIQAYPTSHDEEYAGLVDVENSAGVDLFVGEGEFLHKGFGSRILRSFLTEVVFRDAGVEVCVIGPGPKNVAAIRAYEKAGFRYFKTVRVPGDPEPEYLMKITREEFEEGGGADG